MNGGDQVEPDPSAGAIAHPRPTTQGSSQERSPEGIATVLAGVAALAGVMLLATLPLALVLVQVDGRTVASYGTDAGHDVALALLGLALLGAAFAALRGGDAVAWGAVAVIGVTTLAVTGLFDLPDVRADGAFGPRLVAAESVPGAAFYLESLGGTLALLSGGFALLLGLGDERGRR